MDVADLVVGQIIALNDDRIAIIRHVGPVHFQAGDWVGIELEEPSGKNDGSVKGERYFECEQDYGMFLRAAGVKQILEQPAQQPAPPPPPQAKPKPTSASTTTAASRSRPSSVHAGVNGVKKQEVAPGRRGSAVMGPGLV
jgi:dynactin 1